MRNQEQSKGKLNILNSPIQILQISQNENLIVVRLSINSILKVLEKIIVVMVETQNLQMATTSLSSASPVISDHTHSNIPTYKPTQTEVSFTQSTAHRLTSLYPPSIPQYLCDALAADVEEACAEAIKEGKFCLWLVYVHEMSKLLYELAYEWRVYGLTKIKHLRLTSTWEFWPTTTMSTTTH